MSISKTLASEQAKEDALYAIRKKALEDKLALLSEGGLIESAETIKLKNTLLAIEKDHNKQKAENVKKTEDLKREIFSQGIDFAKDALSIGIDLLSKDEQARKKNAGIIKAFSIDLLTNKGM